MLSPRILFEDTHLIVLSKPAGLLSQGEHTGDENLVDWARAHFGRHYVGLVHRLDRNTSGLMVLAKRTKSAQRLTTALQNGELVREYLGWVHGTVAAPARWEHWLLKNPDTNESRVVAAGTAGAKRAALEASPVRGGLWKNAPLTLVEFRLETGRSHQIRAQAAAQGHALLGDANSGRADGFARPALHSHRISFPHPMPSGPPGPLSFEDPLPEDLALP